MASLSNMVITVELTDKAQTKLDAMLEEISSIRTVLESAEKMREELEITRAAYDVMHEAWQRIPFPAIIRLENNAPANAAMEDSWQQVADWIGTPFVEEWLGRDDADRKTTNQEEP